jgi:hypothetical protein
MFSFFKPWQEQLIGKSWMKDVGYVEPVRETPPPTPVYQIGRTEDGRITLRIGDGYTHLTLTMNETAVNRLIRMLEVAAEKEEE